MPVEKSIIDILHKDQIYYIPYQKLFQHLNCFLIIKDFNSVFYIYKLIFKKNQTY